MNTMTNNQTGTEFQKLDIHHLAAFLNLEVNDLDKLNAVQLTSLLQKLVAVSQMKLTRLALK